MHIPLCDPRLEYLEYKEEIDTAISRVLNGGHYILGDEVLQFEDKFAIDTASTYCVATSNATSGLYMALYALVGDSDFNAEVIVPTMTVTADVEAVRMCRAKAVLCDVDPCRGVIRPEDVEPLITKNTKAVIVVHLYGNLCDVCGIRLMLDNIGRQDIAIIEDCAHAHGVWKNSGIGSAAVFSFFPSKVLGCLGDGGCVVTNDVVTEQTIRAFRNHGRMPNAKHTHNCQGFNFRMDALQAAVLSAKLPYLPEMVRMRQRVANIYRENLCMEFPCIADESSSYYVFPILNKTHYNIEAHLKENGVATGKHYPIPLHAQPICCCVDRAFPNANAIARAEVSLPMYPLLHESQQSRVIALVREATDKFRL